MQPFHRHLAPVGLVAAALVLAGCSGDESGGGAEGPEPSMSGTVSVPADDDADDTAAAYVEAPEGVELTEPGSTLSYRDSAVAGWTPRQDLVGVVEVTVAAVQSAQLTRDFAGYDVVNASPPPAPYFVRAEVENVGDTDLGARRLPLYAIDQDGTLVEPSTIGRGFVPCPGGTLPAVFAAGDTAETCLVFLMPTDTRVDGIMFRPPEGVAPLMWDGGVTAYEVPKPRKPGKRGNGRSGDDTVS